MKVPIKVTITLGALILAGSLAFAADVGIGVLGLFHPRRFAVSSADGNAVVVHAGQETFVLEKSSGVRVAQIRALATTMVGRVGIHVAHTSELTVTGRAGGPADILLAVPEKITRHYRETLELKPGSGDRAGSLFRTQPATVQYEAAFLTTLYTHCTTRVRSRVKRLRMRVNGLSRKTIGETSTFRATTGVLMKCVAAERVAPGRYPDASLSGAEGRR
jgi:hypothetical protein